MDIRDAREHGFLANNVEQAWGIDDVYTELVRHAEEGDQSSVYKLVELARHYDGENKNTIVKFISDALVRLGVNPASSDSDSDEG